MFARGCHFNYTDGSRQNGMVYFDVRDRSTFQVIVPLALYYRRQV
jgi:hypothetical protein